MTTGRSGRPEQRAKQEILTNYSGGSRFVAHGIDISVITHLDIGALGYITALNSRDGAAGLGGLGNC
jgi:hypothetical protein